MLLLDRISDVIMAACCLHNFVIQAGNVDEELNSDFEDSDSEDEEAQADNDATFAAAKRKRNRIKILLVG